MAMKPALAAARTVEVMDHFTTHPNSVFSLSELAVTMNVNLPSMSTVLLALTKSGYLLRHPVRKTFEIGPAFVAIGRAAASHYPIVDLARDEMIELAKLGGECIGSVKAGGNLLVLAVEGRPTPGAREIYVGQRLPLLPPYGQMFLAWSKPAEIAAWVALLDPLDAERVAPTLE